MKPKRKTSIHNEGGEGETERTRNADAFAKKKYQKGTFF
jgi:hypothetical protein